MTDLEKAQERFNQSLEEFQEAFTKGIVEPLLEAFSIMFDNMTRQLRQPEIEELPQAAEEDFYVSKEIIPYDVCDNQQTLE